MTPRPSLLYVHNTPIGDALANQVQTLEMCRALQMSGFDVTLMIPEGTLSPTDVSDAIERELGEKPTFKIKFWEIKRIPGLPRTLKLMYSLWLTKNSLKRHDYTFIRYAAFLPVVVNIGSRVIFESHDINVFTRLLPLTWTMSRWIVRRTNDGKIVLLIAISKALSSHWTDLGTRESAVVALHDGVREDELTTRIDKVDAQLKLGINQQSPIVVYAGTLIPDREPERILFLARDLPHVTFIIVGGTSDQLRLSLGNRSEKFPANLICVGRVPHHDVPTYLAAADALLMLWTWKVPTIRYCSPLKMFEYMAAERTIVGEAYPTITEVLKAGESAILVEPGNYEALRAAVAKAIESTDSSHAQNARDSVHQYTWERRAATIFATVNKLS